MGNNMKVKNKALIKLVCYMYEFVHNILDKELLTEKGTKVNLIC